ncbi:hypothetical protein [Nocardiopsis ansamitocini]|uniref:Secreted protein n=1 Tax=Nocardiopsis ansamitocini TaxID=1670832 RepID=A0A9W6UGM9_9ACTN|nr:hypothetical protein [Nocardiopsis ansamitocini]GLU47791.1 hypothetical protein Nans01_21420 [Nocardiopsis ansamitocini]
MRKPQRWTALAGAATVSLAAFGAAGNTAAAGDQPPHLPWPVVQQKASSYSLDGFDVNYLPPGLDRYGISAESSTDRRGNRTSHVSWVQGPGVVYGKVTVVRDDKLTELDKVRDARYSHLAPQHLEKTAVNGRDAYVSEATGDAFWLDREGVAVTLFLQPERWKRAELTAMAEGVTARESGSTATPVDIFPGLIPPFTLPFEFGQPTPSAAPSTLPSAVPSARPSAGPGDGQSEKPAEPAQPPGAQQPVQQKPAEPAVPAEPAEPATPAEPVEATAPKPPAEAPAAPAAPVAKPPLEPPVVPPGNTGAPVAKPSPAAPAPSGPGAQPSRGPSTQPQKDGEKELSEAMIAEISSCLISGVSPSEETTEDETDDPGGVSSVVTSSGATIPGWDTQTWLRTDESARTAAVTECAAAFDVQKWQIDEMVLNLSGEDTKEPAASPSPSTKASRPEANAPQDKPEANKPEASGKPAAEPQQGRGLWDLLPWL